MIPFPLQKTSFGKTEYIHLIYRRYSQWLEDHPSERDRLQLIQGTLESYVAACRARQDKAYAFPYSIMLELLENYNR